MIEPWLTTTARTDALVLLDFRQPEDGGQHPVRLAGAQLGPQLRALAEDDITAHSDEGLNRRLRVRLFRQLLDDPVLYYDELTDSEREYLAGQRGSILSEIETATGLVREVRVLQRAERQSAFRRCNSNFAGAIAAGKNESWFDG